MADEADATLRMDVDVPGFMKHVTDMLTKTTERFKAMGSTISNVFTSAFSGGGNRTSWQQTPAAQYTRELKDQTKWAGELLKIEKQRRDVQRAKRFDENRARYGEDAELDYEGNLKRKRRDYDEVERMRYRVGATANMINMAHRFSDSGGSDQGLIGLATGVGSMLAPQWAAAIQAGGSFATSAFDKRDNFREQALRRYQVAGALGENSDSNDGSMNLDLIRKGLGFTIAEYTDFFVKAAKGDGLQGDVEATMHRVMMGERFLGIGSNMTNVLTAGGRSGSMQAGDQQMFLGTALGLALQQGLSKGRIGEAFDQIARAIEGNTYAVTDVAGTASRFAFIASMGDRYRGDTAAAQDVDRSMKGWLSSQDPYQQMSSLRAAGFGSGKSYAEALEATQMGLDVEGGVDSRNLNMKMLGRFVKPYMNAKTEAEKARVVMIASKLTGMPMPRVRDMLERIATKGYGADVMPASISEYGAPGYLYDHRTNKAVGEDSGRVGIQEGLFGLLSRIGQKALGIENTTEAVKGSVSSTQSKVMLRAAAQQAGLSPEFMQAWINHESGGKIGTTTKLNERGLFQIMGAHWINRDGEKRWVSHADSEAGGLGMTEDEHARLSTDPALNYKYGAKLAGKYHRKALANAKKYGLNWNESDILKLTKLNHGGVGIERDAIEASIKALGRAPTSYDEMMRSAMPFLDKRARDEVTVVVKIVDRTENGVSTSNATKEYANKSKEPAPGDAAANNR